MNHPTLLIIAGLVVSLSLDIFLVEILRLTRGRFGW
jgi:hypothetical protein